MGLEMPDWQLTPWPGQEQSHRGSESAKMAQESDRGQGAGQWVGVDTRLPGASGPHVDETVVVHVQGVPVLVEPVGREVHGQGE